uniref:Uncharacterized protein n=1 Tax=Gossypium raimondii TaxID=29730 RepID=A0A0D2RCJ1_GOSRA|nr:hypothetical protein B456_005G103300 [Gossypium raimondii]
MKAEFIRILPHVQSFLAVSLEIFIINATSILLIHGVVFSTSKKYDYPPLVSNMGWLGLLSVARLGGQCALGCGGAIFAQPPNLMPFPCCGRTSACGVVQPMGKIALTPHCSVLPTASLGFTRPRRGRGLL